MQLRLQREIFLIFKAVAILSQAKHDAQRVQLNTGSLEGNSLATAIGNTGGQ